MITPQEVSKILRSYLPTASQATIGMLSTDICREMELTLFTLIRDAVSRINDQP